MQKYCVYNIISAHELFKNKIIKTITSNAFKNLKHIMKVVSDYDA